MRYKLALASLTFLAGPALSDDDWSQSPDPRYRCAAREFQHWSHSVEDEVNANLKEWIKNRAGKTQDDLKLAMRMFVRDAITKKCAFGADAD